MNTLKVKVKDQFDREYIAIAVLNQIHQQDAELYKQIGHIVLDDEIILPNMDLCFESQQDNKIYQVHEIAN